MPKKKKLVPNSGKSISEIQQLPGNTYTADGVSSLTFAKHYEYFKDINCIYSEEYPEGKMLELVHIVLYCRFKSFQVDGKKCYESQAKLGQICKCDPGTIGDKIDELVKMGLVRKDPNPNKMYDTLVYTALEITDAHVIPPDQLPAAPIIVSDKVPHQPAQMPVPEPEKAAEEKADVAPDWDAWDAPEHLEPSATTPPMNEMDAACTILIRNIDNQSEMESFTQFTERVCRNNRKIRLPQGIEDYFKNTHPEHYNIFDPIPF